jgi:formylglycine-generating enzyme required for sulfatase activity
MAEAQRQEAIARRERSNVLRLSAFQELEDLEREAAALWPAVPAKIPLMEAWLARSARLIAGLEPGGDEDAGHRARLAELRARATHPAPEERARRIAAHPRGAELERTERKIEAMTKAAAVRAGRIQPVESLLDSETAALDAHALNERAFALVDPARTEFGREAEGLALARLALERSTSGDQQIFVLDTLAWALFANGLDQEALAESRRAAESVKDPPDMQQAFEEYLIRLAQAVEFTRGPSAGEPLAAARTGLAGLQHEVFGSTLPLFENDDDRWWHGQLEELVSAIEEFADPARGLVHGVSPRHGWGVEKRVEFARALEERTLSGSAARELWAAARAEISDRTLSPLYDGLELRPQLGILPLGRDPESGLQEFADVATGEPPQRGADGQLEIRPESSVVFVLLPGGAFELGAQKQESSRPRYDPAADANEGPVHVIELAPFFLSKYELTQGQWVRLTGNNPSTYLAGTYKAEGRIDLRSPVEGVSWLEAERTLVRLGWQLPTEAQWEYAARAGTQSPWWTGDQILSLENAANLSDRYARDYRAPWGSFQNELDDGYYAHAPVGTFEPNPFGFHDVIGNVFEWCRDAYGEFALSTAPDDGLRLGGNPATRVVRGGSFVTAAIGARVSKRDSAPAELENESIGLRPMRSVDP